ncbi:hypothetical protein [Massilia sp. TS11]|uniref:hypothetical protein n=1 Tax=Massilia sp. TS11 TaxID=2908003 RepID=UPI001EDC5F54|nr:hypothetical protein [Massilia sp. TS11]MCG2586536.1 hypothetical protein [Massilia sp. TS11]
MSDHREALEQILVLCNQSRTYTRRIQAIHEVAMYALGLTQSQRKARHVNVFERIGDKPGRDAFLLRQERRLQIAAATERNAAMRGEECAS